MRTAGFTRLVLMTVTVFSYQFGYCQDSVITDDAETSASLSPGDIGYPKDANVINVEWKVFGAKGGDLVDDTEAILKALRWHNASSPKTFGALNPRTIYFPAGTYIVSDTIFAEDRNYPGTATSSIRLLGAGVGRTVIKLKDGSKGFEEGKEKYVVQTGNKRNQNGDLGQPNAGYGNYIQHLTIDTGKGNPGAVGIRFDVANMGAMQNVKIQSGDRNGKVGLLFDSIVGTGYVNKVEIDGFKTGVQFDFNPVNNIVFDDLTISNASDTGIDLGGKNIQVHNLKTFNSPRAIKSTLPHSSIILIKANFNLSPDLSFGFPISIHENSFFFGRDLTASPGFKGMIKSGDKSVTGKEDFSKQIRVREWSSHDARQGDSSISYGSDGDQVVSMNLPVPDVPEMAIGATPPHNEWANVRTFGAKADGVTDDTAAFQDAIDSGAKIVYVPYGSYYIRGRVLVRNGVRRVDFLFSDIQGPGAIVVNGYGIGNLGAEVSLENLVSQGVSVTHNSNMNVVLKNIQVPRIGVGDSATGDFFIENVGPRTVVEIDRVRAWIRQLNREIVGGTNRGGTVWLLGDNIEGKHFRQGNYIRQESFSTLSGGRTEILGGAIDALCYHGAGRDPHPIYSAVTLPSDGRKSKISVVSASLAGQAKHFKSGAVWNDKKLVFGSWDWLLLDQWGAGKANRVELLDSYGIKIKVRDIQERLFMPLYTSP